METNININKPQTQKSKLPIVMITIGILLIAIYIVSSVFNKQPEITIEDNNTQNKENSQENIVADIDLTTEEIENMSLSEILSYGNEDSDQEQTKINESAKSTVMIKNTENEDTKIVTISVEPKGTPLDIVEAKMAYDPTLTTILGFEGSEAFPDTDNNRIVPNEKYVGIYTHANPDSKNNTPTLDVSHINYEGENTFSIIENRTFAISGEEIIDLKLP